MNDIFHAVIVAEIRYDTFSIDTALSIESLKVTLYHKITINCSETHLK